MRVNLGFFKFGTDDKTQAVAVILTMVLLPSIVAIALCAEPTDQIKSLMELLKSALLITIGVAVGNSVPKFGNGD